MPSRRYSNAAVPTSLSSAINNVATNITVASKAGYPTVYPFTITLEKNVTGQGEACEVTGPGTNAATDWTVVRGVDGTTAVAHGAGSLVSHDHTARDYDEWQAIRDLTIMTPELASPCMKRAVLNAHATAGTSVGLTVPAGRKYVIKSIILGNNSSSAYSARLSISGTAWLAVDVLVKPMEFQHIPMALVLNAGEALNFASNTSNFGWAIVNYVDLPATDIPVRLHQATQQGSTGVWNTVYTAPSKMLVTHMMFAHNGNAVGQTEYDVRIGTSGSVIPAAGYLNTGEYHVVTTPFVLETGEILQIWPGTTGLGLAISGLPIA